MAAVPFTGSAAGFAAGSLNLSSATILLTGSSAALGGGTLNGIVGSIISLTGTSPGLGGGTLNGTLLTQFSGRAEGLADGSLRLSTTHSFTGRAAALAGGTLTGEVDTQGLTLTHVARAVLSLWGRCGCELADVPECDRQDITNYINQAHQLIYSQAHRLDYFNVSTLDVTVTSSGSVTLTQTIQNGGGHVRLASNNVPLSPIHTRSEFDQFVDMYLGGVANAPAYPCAYFLDASKQSQGDNVALTLHVTPAPSGNTALKVDACMEPERYTWTDIVRGAQVEIPHKYAESILLPIVRKMATAHRLFSDTPKQKQIDEQHQSAMETLGLVDPKPTTVLSTQKP